MSKFNEQLAKEAQHIRLTSAEKDAMRQALHTVMHGEVPSVSPVASPYFIFSFQFNSVARYAMAAIAVFVFIGGGTVSAAAGALPGDLLYPIKIAVNERAELALATNTEAKLQAEVRFAERRVAEAEALEEEGRLDVATTVELEREFDRHEQNALALAAEVSVEAETEDPEASSRASLKVTEQANVAEEDSTLMTMSMSAPSLDATTTATTSVETEVKKDEPRDFKAHLKARREALQELRVRIELRVREGVDPRLEDEREVKAQPSAQHEKEGHVEEDVTQTEEESPGPEKEVEEGDARETPKEEESLLQLRLPSF